jgi:NAD(P)-dependent dehydrogenase (short-subunit alcohol dehydrogenase family)
VYATALASEGAAVVCADINEGRAAETAARIRDAGGRAAVSGVDVSDEAATLAMAKQAAETFGGIDILVNNAAIYHSMRMDPMMTVDLDYWNKVMAVNVNGVLLCTRAVAPHMKERGRGKIVNQASGAAYSGGGHYALSKMAVVHLTTGFARELGPFNITVNCIAPGVIDTEATRLTVSGQLLDQLVQRQSLRKQGEPEDLVGTLLFLTSSLSDWLTGQVMMLDGGRQLRI